MIEEGAVVHLVWPYTFLGGRPSGSEALAFPTVGDRGEVRSDIDEDGTVHVMWHRVGLVLWTDVNCLGPAKPVVVPTDPVDLAEWLLS